MSVPLFVHTAPLPFLNSSVVMLVAGDYEVSTDIIDSVCNLSLSIVGSSGSQLLERIQNGQQIKVEAKSLARATIVVEGKERYINLTLKK